MGRIRGMSGALTCNSRGATVPKRMAPHPFHREMTRFAALSLKIVLLVASASWLAAGGMSQEPLAPGVRLEKNVPGRMRDGVLLRADVYRPAGAGPWPALRHRHPQ
jgi:predicted acyl esterase